MEATGESEQSGKWLVWAPNSAWQNRPVPNELRCHALRMHAASAALDQPPTQDRSAEACSPAPYVRSERDRTGWPDVAISNAHRLRHFLLKFFQSLRQHRPVL